MDDEKKEKTGIRTTRRDCKLTRLLDDLRKEGAFGPRYADELEKAVNEEFKQFERELIDEMKKTFAFAQYDDYTEEDQE